MSLADKPAFPDPDTRYPDKGMTLREYYAGLAMQGILANPTPMKKDVSIEEGAILVADALIKQLEEK